jgi:L-seryl-tRNA(Ser) seleniumtransferase
MGMQKMGMQKRTRAATEALKRLPAVSRILETAGAAPLLASHGPVLVTDLVRAELDRLRRGILEGRLEGASLADALAEPAILAAVAAAAERLLAPRPRAVINATGVIVHTNLGRSTLSAAAAAEVALAARSYLDLEYDVEEGARGSRLAHLAPLVERLFPGHDFTVVNNNAAAVLLCLRALAAGREVPIARGELVEIGGSFRMPDIFELSGARLREVGTTNRTRLADYERALGQATGALLKVHTSNFRIVGFVEETPIEELAGLARRAGVPLIVDWGSGSLVDLTEQGIRDEIPARELLRRGAELVTFSGDKLLGGPQSGFVVGRPELVARLKRDPLSRACRIDRLRVGALNRTLAAHVRGRAFQEIPTLCMLALGVAELDRAARALRDALEADAARRGARVAVEVVDGVSRTGGGSSPSGERPTRLVAVAFEGRDAGALEQALREGDPPVIARIQQGRLLLDPRTVLPGQEPVLVRRLVEALAVTARR